MLVPNRHASIDSYRYGFQGQEKDDEIKGEGNSLNYTFRMHDPRLGRFFAVDPLTKKYPFYSPYAFSGNRVIDAIELEGLEPRIVLDAVTGKYGKTMQKVVTGSVEGVAESLNATWDFFTKDAWKEETWQGLGKVVMCPEPAFDAGVDKYNKEVTNGDAYSRSKYLSKLTTDIATIYVGSKGVNLLVSEAVNISKISLLKQMNIILPKLGSMTNFEARVWYLQNEAKIPNLIKKFSTLEKQAKAAFNLRNEFRTAARDLMADRKLAAKITAENPNLTWNEVIQKAKDKGLIGDDIYKDIIEGSQKSRTSVNESLGVDKPKK